MFSVNASSWLGGKLNACFDLSFVHQVSATHCIKNFLSSGRFLPAMAGMRSLQVCEHQTLSLLPISTVRAGCGLLYREDTSSVC